MNYGGDGSHARGVGVDIVGLKKSRGFKVKLRTTIFSITIFLLMSMFLVAEAPKRPDNVSNHASWYNKKKNYLFKK